MRSVAQKYSGVIGPFLLVEMEKHISHLTYLLSFRIELVFEVVEELFDVIDGGTFRNIAEDQG